MGNERPTTLSTVLLVYTIRFRNVRKEKKERRKKKKREKVRLSPNIIRFRRVRHIRRKVEGFPRRERQRE